MILFDDEPGEMHEVSKLGVFCVPVYHGMSTKILEQGIKEFQHGKPRYGLQQYNYNYTFIVAFSFRQIYRC